MTAIHPNSAAAYAATGAERPRYEEKIMELMADFKPRTDREIGNWLESVGFKTEQYRARIHDLLEGGRLVEDGSVVCQTTRKPVRLTRKSL